MTTNPISNPHRFDVLLVERLSLHHLDSRRAFVPLDFETVTKASWRLNHDDPAFSGRVWVFILIALGVGALWGLSMVGGFGGHSDPSTWWGKLILPYLIGWSMGIWGPGSPRWLLLLGILVGLWYETIVVMVLTPAVPRAATLGPGTFVLGALGVLTIGGGMSRLRNRAAEPH